MDEDASIIYGLELQTRALCAQAGESEVKRFLVGTQSFKLANQVHLVEYDDETNSLSKCIFEHREGEIWHIAAAPHDKRLFLTCYNKVHSPNIVSTKCSVWKMPDECEMSTLSDDSTHFALTHLAELPVDSSIAAIWEPNGKSVISLSDNCIYNFDLADSKPKLIGSVNLEARGQPKFINAKWNPHHNNSQIATCNDTAIRGWDLKSMKQIYVIENAHGQSVRDIDFNPNKQYYLASCGDDGKTKFWDVRKSNECLKTLTNHSHWVWSVRYNSFHDQLVLTCSSDNHVALSSISSLSSEPYRTVLDDEVVTPHPPNGTSAEKQIAEPDRLIKMYDEHEDSVYAIEWSNAEPWIFASLSYDGRLAISKVPKEEKYKIML